MLRIGRLYFKDARNSYRDICFVRYTISSITKKVVRVNEVYSANDGVIIASDNTINFLVADVYDGFTSVGSVTLKELLSYKGVGGLVVARANTYEFEVVAFCVTAIGCEIDNLLRYKKNKKIKSSSNQDIISIDNVKHFVTFQSPAYVKLSPVSGLANYRFYSIGDYLIFLYTSGLWEFMVTSKGDMLSVATMKKHLARDDNYFGSPTIHHIGTHTSYCKSGATIYNVSDINKLMTLLAKAKLMGICLDI